MYLDSGSAVQKDYKNIKAVLDDALNGFAYKHGPLRKPNRRQGKHTFTHKTEFPCLKQLEGSPREAYYAIHHMREFVRDQQRLMLLDSLQQWRKDLVNVEDGDLRMEFYRVQQKIADVIFNDVCKKEGMFFNSFVLPSNDEIRTRLEMQRDGRAFNTKDGVLPFPPIQKDVYKKK